MNINWVHFAVTASHVTEHPPITNRDSGSIKFRSRVPYPGGVGGITFNDVTARNSSPLNESLSDFGTLNNIFERTFIRDLSG